MSIVFAVLLLAAMAWAVWESELMIEQKKRDERGEK
jgi:glucose dehydrogenase